MVRGEDFEVSKEVYERAKANSVDKDESSFYMASEDKHKLFSEAILCGYGLYDCQVHEKDGKYVCTWWRGSSCD